MLRVMYSCQLLQLHYNLKFWNEMNFFLPTKHLNLIRAWTSLFYMRAFCKLVALNFRTNVYFTFDHVLFRIIITLLYVSAIDRSSFFFYLEYCHWDISATKKIIEPFPQEAAAIINISNWVPQWVDQHRDE